MKKITFFLALLLSGALANAQTASSSSSNITSSGAALTKTEDISKVLEFNEENHDFGKIPYGKLVEYNVAIKNISSDSVQIENVKVGCGCTTPKYEQGKSYTPGEDFKVTLGFTGYADGPFDKYVDIFFNNGLTKRIKFHGVGYKVPETPAPASAAQKLKSDVK